MGFFEVLKNRINQISEENAQFGSRGLDIIADTPEVREYCLKKVRGQMMFQFIKPCISSAIVLTGALIFRFIRQMNGIGIEREEPTAIMIVAALVLGIPLLSYLVFFDGYKYLRRGNYELYGGYCLMKYGNGRNDVKMNGAYLHVDSLRFDSVSVSCYFYIMRVPLKKKTLYFFAPADKSAAQTRTGDFYPEDI